MLLALDLFCCAGGAAMGLHRAGFEVIGVDIKPQPNYPFKFVQADCMSLPFDLSIFDFIWASPPCQSYSVTKSLHKNEHPDLVGPVRDMLVRSGRLFVIENVMGAPLLNPFMLCGTMFDLRVYRHRIFEANFLVLTPPHGKHVAGSTGSHRGYSRGGGMICVAGNNYQADDGRRAMDIDWMSSRRELSQAIPPAYSEFIGRQAMKALS